MSTLISQQMKAKKFKTDAALAAVVGCDRSMITRVKLGKAAPSLDLAVRLAKALDLPADAFLPEKAA
jgi:transcriptional regulator with XRE-family HTH domain